MPRRKASTSINGSSSGSSGSSGSSTSAGRPLATLPGGGADYVSAAERFAGEGEAATFTGRRKIAIVGYTTSANEAPYADDEWEIWGMNDLHMIQRASMDFKGAFEAGKFHVWFDLHVLDKQYQEDKAAHCAWLRTPRKMPIVVWDNDGLPENCVSYPLSEMLDKFGRYFTNTVSWQLAYAISLLAGIEGAEIGVYGVNMAIDEEYSSQKPSVEYFLGLARGMGIKVTIPETSDLLQTATLYGLEKDTSGERLRVRQQELIDQLNEVAAQLDHCLMMKHKIEGALEQVRYELKIMHQPAMTRPALD